MASLRSRLLAAVVAITAVGLVLLAGIVYLEQRSFLLDRADQQAEAAIVPLTREISERASGESDGPGGPGGADGLSPEQRLPTGTWAELLDAEGRRIGDPVQLRFYGQDPIPPPAIPAGIGPGDHRTVDAVRGAGRYRAVAQRDRFSGALAVVAVPLREADQTLRRLLLVEGLVIAGVLLVAGLVAWIVVRVGLLPLDRMGHTAGRIAGGDLSQRVTETDPRSEVGRLGGSLNAMLDRLEQAFAERRASEERLRRFIADASHELRTPLTSIRGYAELYRLGATRGPEEVAQAMRRIEDEAARMGGLVEDLLMLARLDAVAGAPHVEVDLAELARDAVSDARATAPDRAIGLEAAGGALVHGEPDQLRQVLANLLRNALVHTPAGTPIEVAVRVEDGTVRLDVRDHGPGLPTDDPGALFERFWRAEGGRERGRGGAGLGLAIVAGIVDAHGGSVAAADVQGGGARFTALLPSAGATARR